MGIMKKNEQKKGQQQIFSKHIHRCLMGAYA
jgi:hypothetical protein